VDAEPDFLSFARGWSFFGKSKQTNASIPQLIKQAMSDPDAVNKYLAYRAVADVEKAKVIDGLLKGDSKTEISADFIKLHATILFSEELTPSARALTLVESNRIQSRDDLSHHYVAVKDATTALLQAVWAKHSAEIEAAYAKLAAESRAGPHYEQFQERSLKRHLLSLIVAGAKAPVLSTIPKVVPAVAPALLALDLLKKSTFASDQLPGFRYVLGDETFADREKVQEEIFEQWRQHPDTMTKYIGIVSSLESPEVGKQILKLIAHPDFNPAQSSHGRTLTRCLSQIRHFSLSTDEGLEVMGEVFTKLGKVNQMAAYPILQSFDHLDRFDEAQKAKLLTFLQKLQDSIDKKKEESLYNQLNIILKKV
jgi:aminopeptidase N